jgi:MAE_28990/MAE_18760-like HEPN
MKIQTLENLNQRLTDELIWRKREIADLKALIDNRGFTASKHNTLLRSGVTILYAHWEGYIKIASKSYLEFVARQKLTYDELAINFIAIAMKVKLNEVTEASKATVFTEATRFILTQTNQRSSIPYENVVATGSNLSSSILREITCLLGLEYTFYETHQVIIDEQLLSRRNKIAHGERLEYLSLSRDEYQQLHEQILSMMEYFRNQIENHAAQQLYLRNH